MNQKPKKKSTFQKVTMGVVIVMLIATLAGIVIGVVQALR
ncbi:MAG: DUF4044 domain-containing protein [Streptococcaceae bacterium]|jgi:flagellar basal body-associated protein FliL|nr:DUF4044 domain-containing protein [Streptococcaceae bacterium]